MPQGRSEQEIAEYKYNLVINKMVRTLNSPHSEHYDRARAEADTLLAEINEKKGIGKEGEEGKHPQQLRREREDLRNKRHR